MNIMTIFKVGDEYADTDFPLLSRHLQLLDIELASLNAAIAVSRDPESDGLFDTAEYFIGHGFVAIQRYLTATRTGLGAGLTEALSMPPMANSMISVVAAINAAANYWKHVEEWVEALNRSDESELQSQAKKTLAQVEAITPWEEYTCANLMAGLLPGQPLELSRLLPQVEVWRNNLFAKFAMVRSVSGS